MSSSSVHADPPPPVVTEPSGINYATSIALGKGGFAICHKAERLDGAKPTGHIVALKIVKTKMEPAKLAQKLQIHSKLSHPNIVTFYRAFSFQTSTYVVLELCPNGSLADMLKKRKNLSLPEIRRLVIQVCGAVKYLHHRHIVHRDLKTGNLFLDEHMNVKVGDFGLAALLVTERDMEVRRRTTMCGTPNYLAPEILEKGKGHDEKVDLWAIGVIAYTLAVGKAPFHASTKEEIYKKLKSGTYTWPELSATNNQSTDLRDLVSRILVSEEQRPSPDEIVSHAFFKIAYVPAEIPTTARTLAPQWDVSMPSSDTIRRGYSETWFDLCKLSGVGEYEPGKAFPLNGGRKVRSIVHDMERETQLGRQPQMPIPKDVVYSSMISDFDAARSTPDNSTASVEAASRELKEIALNEVASTRPRAADSEKAKRDAALMPPPRAPSRAATSRSGTVRRPARTISEETVAKSNESVRIQSDSSSSGPSSAATLKVSRVRPAPSSAASAPSTVTLGSTTRENKNASSTAASYQTAKTEQSADPLEKPSRTNSVKRSADASLARRPRETNPAVPGTDPATVLEKLSVFRNNLATALQKSASAKTTSSLRSNMPDESANLPFVSRWVDYSRKHGVGYVLSDGTVGCIINATAKPKQTPTPVTHVIVRNGQRWLQKVGKNKDFAGIEQVPLEVFEDGDLEGIKRKVYKGLGSVKEGPLAVEAERRRTLSVLWVKFGRYMCQSLDGQEEDVGKNHDGNFVRFYQRIGNVGVWAFADGCLQIHFPDHTKLVISADGRSVSATVLSTDAVSHLSQNGELLPAQINQRQVLADSIHALLFEGGRVRQRIVKANQLADKLAFVQDAVSQWVANGGLGRLDEDDATGDKLYWEGLTVKDGARKVDRVTVGRYGGDDVRPPLLNA
ncbi:uncharacterized protein MYCFIDRAFT_156841 [Pseudocercospora fijiensis CIRAD86]|uniref:Protein kinase domain-containing protein n=1 Tax=Pseudocercospora fijiensis (strain CIRAD86) TaxID=383855 RepID=M3AR51_PSEFD|nr:uncharacterized protein MYCFIDRAFT_156841 [Pseudocercospora fijiensis CIRAD86]EME79573.1 hypothetical protein MYCFIDRAFT_156841 [Pseudocercospora fijiensis CIRAD86]